MFVLPKTSPPKNLDRCDLCGMVIGDYKWDKKIMRPKYYYPICISYKSGFYAIDMGCYENLLMYPRKKLKFDAISDRFLK